MRHSANTTLRGRLLAFCVLSSAALLTACGTTRENDGVPASPAPIQVGAENVVSVAREDIVVGPTVSGELRPAREATIRAELGGSLIQMNVDEGQSVRRGTIVGRIEARTLDEARVSAASAVRSTESQLSVARREAERTEQLVSAGALASREIDLARSNVSAAEAQLADARSRLAAAERQLDDAIIRAPFDGIVSDRAVNAGDVVTPGTALVTIIDPSSMRLEASVPSDDLNSLRVGAPVRFQVRGYDEPFEGRIERIAPEADRATRQVPIFVSIPNTGGRLVAGLFAEGRVVSESAHALVVPISTVNMSEEDPWVLRVTDGQAEKVPVTLGLTDLRTERVQISAGVAEGDTLLRGAAQGITPGTRVDVSR